jgi:hypothetical protein
MSYRDVWAGQRRHLRWWQSTQSWWKEPVTPNQRACFSKKHSDQFPNYLSGPSLEGENVARYTEEEVEGNRGGWRMKRKIEEEDEWVCAH